MLKAWITGAGGLIGNYLVQTAPHYGLAWRVVGLTRAALDLTDFSNVRSRFQHDHPQLIIHCAALSRGPACEADPVLARKLNVDVTACLADLAVDIPFILFSSDLVFDGLKGNYAETDAPAAWCVYSETKIAAEQIVLKNPKHSVVRTSLNAGVSPTGERSFNEQMRRDWQAGRVLKLFVDEYRCPLPAVVTARAVWELAGLNRPGLYHLAGRE